VIAEYVLLAGRIHQELVDLEQAIARAGRASQAAQEATADHDLYVDAAALNLHDFYTGLERAFQQVAAIVDKSVPAGPDWHRALLEQMCVAFPDVRPAVLSRDTCQALSEFMRFRHVVRNVYAYNLDAQRVQRLVDDGARLYEQVKAEFIQFASFLDQVGRDDRR